MNEQEAFNQMASVIDQVNRALDNGREDSTIKGIADRNYHQFLEALKVMDRHLTGDIQARINDEKDIKELLYDFEMVELSLSDKQSKLYLRVTMEEFYNQIYLDTKNKSIKSKWDKLLTRNPNN